MNNFDQKLKEYGYYPLKAKKIYEMCLNVGYKCDLRCTHCCVEASPERTEEMSLDTMNKILNVLSKNSEITSLGIAGGSAELNPHFKYLVKSATDIGKKVNVGSNVVVYFEPGLEDIPEFLAENKTEIFASLPHYTEEVMDKQRGKGTYKKAISALKILNELGYGKEGTSLELGIVFNPAGASIAPDRVALENAYRDKLKEMHGITFNRLVTLNNKPIGRLRKSMSEDEFNTYMKELEEKFNPDRVKNLTCRHTINVSCDGKIYDCGSRAMLDLGRGLHIDDFDYDELKTREIGTSPLCFVCTAGAGTGRNHCCQHEK